MTYAETGKRVLDVSVVVLLAIPALVVCAICVLAIRLDSPGPALFRQTRVGRKRRPFTLYKLRTMATGIGDHASHHVSGSQITRLGHALRLFKIDELPQLINVLRGDMSLVGPRPCLPSQQELVAERDRRGVYTLRPGITGPAQLAGIDMSTPGALAKADAGYLERQTLSYDLRCMLMTATGRGRGDAVRRA